MSISTQRTGKAAEGLAARFLQRQGFQIVARNYRYRRGEIDLIAQVPTLLLFVEVKFRRSASFGHPETFVTPQQQELLRATATQYMIDVAWVQPIRFDIIALSNEKGAPHLQHFEDAF